jgi:hypothetical protein
MMQVTPLEQIHRLNERFLHDYAQGKHLILKTH